MTIIPSSKLAEWKKRSEAADFLILENLIEFREFYDELKNEHALMQAYAEAAQANRMSAATFRDKFGLVKRFGDDDLRRWFEMGLSFDHLDKAPGLAEISHRTPAEVLDFAAEERMTVEQMINWICEEQGKQRAPLLFHFDSLFRKLWKFPALGQWDTDKTERWKQWLEQGKEFFQ